MSLNKDKILPAGSSMLLTMTDNGIGLHFIIIMYYTIIYIPYNNNNNIIMISNSLLLWIN
jgi:hypothetical protein